MKKKLLIFLNGTPSVFEDNTTTSRVWRQSFQNILVFLSLLMPLISEGQISITSSSPYTQDFNTLVNTGTSSTLPAGWALSETGTNTNTTYTAGTGSATGGDTYSFGAASSSDRALGGLQSGSLIPTIGASFTNIQAVK